MSFSFGIFLILGFAGAYLAFRSEYKRKEAEGIIHPFLKTMRNTPPLAWALLGFFIGAKLVYWWLHRSMYIGAFQDFIFSTRGNLMGGLIIGLTVWLIARGNASPPSREMIHPYELMDTILLYCGLWGITGSALFTKFESPAEWGHFSFHWLFSYTGINFYGALISGALTWLYINRRYGIRPAIAADIGSPGMMLAYAIGRMGCHVAGDGDWGIVNENPLPPWLRWLPDWAWAYRYPHNSVREGVYIPDCFGSNCTVLEQPVYPTPLYESLICFCLFFLLWSIRRKIKTPGRMFTIFAILNGAERFFIEFIRVNPRFSIGPLALSQAQILALGWIVAGLIALFISTRKKRLS